MSRLSLLPILLTALLGLIVILGPHAVRLPASGPVYTVAEVRAGMARDPGEWVGRTVWLAAEAEQCIQYVKVDGHTVCAGWQDILVDPGARIPAPNPIAAPSLPFARQPENPALAVLRRLPLLSQILPAGQQPQWGLISTYRVWLRANAQGMCSAPPCYSVVLLDALPGAL